MCLVGCISVCSQTLWIGHISKQTTEEELQQELSKHGEATVRVRAQGFYYCNPLVYGEIIFGLSRLTTQRSGIWRDL